MAADGIRVEYGAWVETSTPKKTGSGMRKAWVSPAPKGENVRLSVIVRHDARDTHTITLHANSPEERQTAAAMLKLALKALESSPASAPTPAPAPARKAPTPPTAKPPLASLPKPAPATGRTLTHTPVPATLAASDTWFADLMAQAGA